MVRSMASLIHTDFMMQKRRLFAGRLFAAKKGG
jgi:hypothetical protein